jgi:CheY-like chemotaxis protein
MAKNILICDDAAFMRMMIKDILTKNGYNVAGLITVETSVSPVRCLSEACAFIGTQIHNMPTVTSRHTIYVAILNLLLQLMILFFILFLSRTFQ